MGKRYKVLVCRGPDCGDRRGSASIHAALVQKLREAPLSDAEVEVAWQSCFGHCHKGPNVLVREVRPGENTSLINLMPTIAEGAVLYHGVGEGDVPRLIHVHLQSGQVLTDLRGKSGDRR